MKSILSLVFVLSVACQSTHSASEPAPTLPHDASPTTEHHAWLHQLLGVWNVTTEASMSPGAEPMKMESTESVRALGSTWVVAEGQMVAQGTPMQSVMTFGYDSNKSAYVGTWIDTMQSHMWVYRGELDAARRTLTLEAEGPSFTDPTRMALYRDAIEIVDANHKKLTSSVRGDDGTWTTFMRADYRKKN